MPFYDPDTFPKPGEIESLMKTREIAIQNTAWELQEQKQRRMHLEALIRDPDYPSLSVLKSVAGQILKAQSPHAPENRF